MLSLSFLCFISARSDITKAERWESFDDEADTADGREDSARSPAQGNADILQLSLSEDAAAEVKRSQT
jgi:hypothetical protein